MKQATIWHTNDVHSCFESFAGIVTALKENADPQKDLILDAGDFCDFRSPMIHGTFGVGGMELLKLAHYDAMAIGNNEFFSGLESLKQMTATGFPMLSCNLFGLQGENLPGVQPFIHLTKNNIRYLVIGCSPYLDEAKKDTSFTDLSGIRLEAPYSILSNILEQEKGSYDISIVLSHAGWDLDEKKAGDREIARKVPGIDLIIGGHTHVNMENIEQIGTTWIHQSGCYGEVLGKLDLQIDESNHLCFVTAENIPNSFEEDPECLKQLDLETQRGVQFLANPLYELDADLDYDSRKECSSVNAVADAFHQEYGGDFALINHGILSGEITKSISKMTLLTVEPSPLILATVVWSGKQVLDAIQSSFEESVSTRRNQRWGGFRGEVLGSLAVSWNVRIQKHPLKVEVDGKPLKEDERYTVITSDFLQRGSGYPMLATSLANVQFHPESIRDLLERTLKDPEFVKRARKRGRIHESYEK